MLGFGAAVVSVETVSIVVARRFGASDRGAFGL
jgi:hypothetical protein